MASLEGKVVVILGGTGGVGAAAARAFASVGATVVPVARPGKQAEADALAASLPGEGHAGAVADVAETPSLVRLRDQVAARQGRADVLVNSAGFTKPVPHADLDALDDELIDRMFAINWRGQFAAIRSFAPLLKATGDGLVVNVSSLSGVTGVGSSIAYCAAKAGIDVMTKSLARVLAPDVRVLAVSPGVVDTNFVPGRGPEQTAKIAATIPLKRIASAQDVADAILACATHLRYSTGHTVLVDGGRSL